MIDSADTYIRIRQVAIGMDWTLSKVIRIEKGAVSISAHDPRALSDLIPGSPAVAA